MPTEPQPAVSIVLLNHNNSRDTIECLESVLRLNYSNFHVVICDNSTDNSMEEFKVWSSSQDAYVPSQNCPVDLTAIREPVSYQFLTEGVVKDLGIKKLTFIKLANNAGYAAGNNVGIKYSLGQQRPDFIWLLNTDTVIDPQSLCALTTQASSRPDLGFIGSVVRYYHNPSRIQAYGGGWYNRYLGLVGNLGDGLSELPDPELVKCLAYIYGAAMFVSAGLIKSVGLMSEEYFLFYEELDWALRSKGAYKLGVAPESVVFHKHSGSIAKGKIGSSKNILEDYYGARGRITITTKFFPWALPLVYAGLCVTLAIRLFKGRPKAFWTVLQAMLHPRSVL